MKTESSNVVSGEEERVMVYDAHGGAFRSMLKEDLEALPIPEDSTWRLVQDVERPNIQFLLLVPTFRHCPNCQNAQKENM